MRLVSFQAFLFASLTSSCYSHFVGGDPPHWAGCGVGDPAFHSYVHASATIVQQSYTEESARARRLGTTPEAYDSLAFAMSIDAAEAAGYLSNIRITIDWSVVDSFDTVGGVKRQCSVLGETIQVDDASGASTVPMVCEAKHIVTGVTGASRGTLMRARTEAARVFWQSALRIRPIRDGSIILGFDVTSRFGMANGASYPNTDLVVIMTARPSPNRPVAGYASCRQRDQYNRCTVGAFNWVPELLNIDSPNDPTNIASEMHTALHELGHVFGLANPVISAATTTPPAPATSMFLGPLGTILDPRGNVYIEELDPIRGRKVAKIVTPRVLNLTRTVFDCPTATGLPLEDVELGKGAHWEAAYTGPELMSYGSGSGQVSISDFSLAFLEDTNQYKANYSMGGKLTPDTVDDFVSAAASLGAAKDSSDTYTPPPAKTPGYPMWGRGAGCAFLTGAPRSAWPARYKCEKANTYVCTSDYRMSAVCVIKADYQGEPAAASYSIDINTGATAASLYNDANRGVPPTFRYFTSDAEAAAATGIAGATAARTGGYSAAQDYVPVPVGYWACNAASANNVSAGVDGTGSGLQLRWTVWCQHEHGDGPVRRPGALPQLPLHAELAAGADALADAGSVVLRPVLPHQLLPAGLPASGHSRPVRQEQGVLVQVPSRGREDLRHRLHGVPHLPASPRLLRHGGRSNGV